MSTLRRLALNITFRRHSCLGLKRNTRNILYCVNDQRNIRNILYCVQRNILYCVQRNIQYNTCNTIYCVYCVGHIRNTIYCVCHCLSFIARIFYKSDNFIVRILALFIGLVPDAQHLRNIVHLGVAYRVPGTWQTPDWLRENLRCFVSVVHPAARSGTCLPCMCLALDIQSSSFCSQRKQLMRLLACCVGCPFPILYPEYFGASKLDLKLSY